MCIPHGQSKTFLKFYTSFCLICNSAICSGMWDKKYIWYTYPSTTFVYNGSMSKLCHDACESKESVRAPKSQLLVIQLQCLMKMQAGCWMPILYRFLRWRAGCAISGLSPKLLPSSPAWHLLLDKVYWTFTITLNFEDDLKSWFPFKIDS